MAEGRVEQIYDQLKQMAVAFRFRPGDRLNEGALARELGVSRTPLREALNRLVAEKMIDFRPGTGFFCRTLDAKTIFDLYELRGILEVSAVHLACERASDAEISTLRDALHATGIEVGGLTIAAACARDEAFHIGIARLSGNEILLAQLEGINERTRYIRWIRMSLGKVRKSKGEHKKIMQAMMKRNPELAGELLQRHIAKRMDQITEAVREGISSIYMDAPDVLSNRVFEEGEE